jgi:peroxiredoxin
MGSILLLARVVLAAVFAVAGIAKLFDLAGSRKSLRDFGVPDALARPFALLLPLAELICAGALLLDSTAWWGANGVAVLFILFIAGISISLARGRKPDCHCFGQLSSEPVGAGTLVRNVVLLGLAGLVIWEGRENPGSWPAVPNLMGAETALLTAVGVLAVALALTIWFLFHMLQQNGRLLVRLEAIEQKLKIDPNAKPVPGLAVGAVAPDFKLAAMEGDPVSLEALSFEDQSLLLAFVEPGCGACETLMPDLAQWQREHAARLRIVPISRGDREANRAKMDQHGVRGALLQTDREISQAYEVKATPSAVIVTRGKITTPLAEGTDDIRKLVRRSTLPPPAKKGDAVPALRLPDLDGAEVDLASLRGRRTLVLFWSTTCGFCQQMLEDVKKWERARPANAPELLIISSGTPEANRQQGFRAPVLLDADWGAGTVLGAGGTPSALIIDEDGKVASDVGVGAPAVLELAGTPAD